MHRLAIIAVAGLAVVGCSDPKAASKKNFEKVINAHIAENPPCIGLPNSTVTPANVQPNAWPRYIDSTASIQGAQALEQYEALVKVGLANGSDSTVQSRQMFGAPRTTNVRVYQLTDMGKEASSEATGMWGGTGTQLCFGTPEVKEIKLFTEPAPAASGATVSQVDYSYTVKDAPAWATNETMTAAFPDLKTLSEGPVEAKALLFLTNEGWKYYTGR